MQTFRAFVTKQLSQKILVTFFGQTPLMKLQKSQLPYQIVQRLAFNTSASKHTEAPYRVMDDRLFN